MITSSSTRILKHLLTRQIGIQTSLKGGNFGSTKSAGMQPFPAGYQRDKHADRSVVRLQVLLHHEAAHRVAEHDRTWEGCRQPNDIVDVVDKGNKCGGARVSGYFDSREG